MPKNREKPFGRPEIYTKEYADNLAKDLVGMFRNGESIAEVCAELGCSKDSFYKMCEISEDFSDAEKNGLLLSEAWWSRLGREGARCETSIQPATYIFNMKNRFDWVDKKELSGPGGNSLFENFARAVAENLEDED